MHKFSRLFALVAVAGFFILPVPVSAAVPLVPVGGFVTTETHCLNGGSYIVVAQAFPPFPGLGSGIFVWRPPPITVTLLYGRPHLGDAVIGFADVPVGCVLSFNPPIVIFGLRLTIIGTYTPLAGV